MSHSFQNACSRFNEIWNHLLHISHGVWSGLLLDFHELWNSRWKSYQKSCGKHPTGLPILSHLSFVTHFLDVCNDTWRFWRYLGGDTQHKAWSDWYVGTLVLNVLIRIQLGKFHWFLFIALLVILLLNLLIAMMGDTYAKVQHSILNRNHSY